MATLSDSDIKELEALGFKVKKDEPAAGPLETAALSGMRATPSTVGALAGMRVPGPLPVKIAGALAGGFGADIGANKLAETFAPELKAEFDKRLGEGTEANKLASIVGEFLPSMVTFSPSGAAPKAIGDLAKSIATRTPLNMTKKLAAKAALKEAATSAAVEGSMDAVMQQALTGNIDPTRALASALAGGTLLQQNKLGRAISGQANLLTPPPTKAPKAEHSELLIKPLPAPEKILRDIPEAELLDNKPYVADIPEKTTPEVKLLLERNPMAKPIKDTVLIETPDGPLVMSTVVKPEGVTLADPTRTLSKARQMQAARVRNESGSALTKEGKKNIFKSGFTPQELAAMDDTYASKLPITEADYMSAKEIAMRKTSKPLQTSQEKLGLVPVRASDLSKNKAKNITKQSANESIKFNIKESDASDIYGANNSFVRITENDSKGYIKLRVYPDGAASVVDLFVPEDRRGKGIGQKLQSEALKKYPNLMGQVSSKAAATTAYRLGRRPVSKPDATIEDVYKMIDDDTSVNLASSENLKARATEPISVAKASILSGETDPSVIEAKLNSIGAENVDGTVSDTLRANFDIAMDRAYQKAKAVKDEPPMFYSLGVTPSQFIGDVSGAMGKVYDFVMNSAIRSVVDRLEHTGNTIDKALSPLFRETITQMTRLYADFYNPAKSKLNRYSNKGINRVWQYMHDIQDTGSSNIKLIGDEVEIHKTIQDALLKPRVVQNDMGLPVKEGTGNNRKFRAGKLNPDYAPQVMSQNVIRLFTKGKEGAIKELRQQFVDWHVNTTKLTPQKANQLFDEIRESFLATRKAQGGNASTFGPLDKAEGIGIPPEWRDMGFNSAFRRYMSRSSRRLAFFDNIENHAWVRQHLNINNPYTGMKDNLNELIPNTGQFVRNADSDIESINALMDIIENRELRTKGAESWESLSRLIKSGIMGPVTGMRDFATGAYIGFQHMTPSQVPGYLLNYVGGASKMAAGRAGQLMAKQLKSVGASNYADYINKHIGSWVEDWERSLAKGVNARHVANIENIDSMGRGLSYMMNRAADVMNLVQARTFFDQTARTAAFTAGRWAIHDMVRRLHSKGTHGKFLIPGTRKQLERQLEIFAGSKAKANGWVTTGKVSERDLDEAAAKFVESTQGTYGPNGLPLYTIDNGAISGLTSLARWSIEKFGNFDKYVVNEARNGNWMPAVMQIGGGLIGGAAMTSIFKHVTGREPIIPEVTELATANETDNLQADELLYTLAAYAQTAGVAGIGADMLYQSMLIQQSSSFDKPLLSFVAMEEAQDIQQIFSDMITSITDDSLSPEDKKKYVINGLGNSIGRRIQGYRLLKDMFSDDIGEYGIERRKSNAKKRQVKFSNLYGYDNLDQVYNQQSMKGLREKQFRKAVTPERINETFLPAVQSAVSRTTDEGQSPQTLLNALEGLKRGESSSIIPGIKSGDEYKATQFLNYIKGSEGQKGLDETVNLFKLEEESTGLKKQLIDALK